MIKISIVEDDKDIRESLAILLNGTEGLQCISTYYNCEAAQKLIEKDKPDVILMDINLPGMNGIECTQLIKQKMPTTEIIMLTVSDDNADVFNSLCAGASGYLKKNTPPLKLIEAIKEAVNGGAPMSMDIARMVVGSFKKETHTSDLTTREKDVLKNLCDGFSYKKIADELFVDLNTVKFHIRNIYRKLEVHSKGEAIAKAMKENLT
ncbi:MAG: DNA-binding response regulator [Calditrichaeota bacterium]|nr:MAG: DNA-binding response regulator [Calditrichota bacterium]MBL1204678.1 DNA-binding response regulator [Calditrichota bacterium]NOG44506.1 response regulator transcription factor [Calditrichota bacterium]